MIETDTWVLPRPRKNKYPGGWPLHFENKLLHLLGTPKKVLHPFGGAAETGLKVDIRKDVNPDIVADAHNLPFKSNSFDAVILDPPYDNEQSEKVFKTGKLHYNKYVSEAVRVCKQGGDVVIYHWVLTPRPENCKLRKRLVILTMVWHRPRVCCVYRKNGSKQVEFL